MTSSTRQQPPAKSPLESQNTTSTDGSKQPLARFGQINFINSLPLTLPLLNAELAETLDITLANPAELNKGYSDGQLDLGAMSSFFFLEHGGLDLVPRISISSIGPVGSVLFFSKSGISNLEGKKLSITAASATSVNLLKVLFLETMGFLPQFEVQAVPTIDEQFDGALVIGDRALHADKEWNDKYVRQDLGKWWFDLFKLPMVFGVWAAGKDWVKEDPERFKNLCGELRALFDKGLGADFPSILEEAGKRTNLSEDRLRYYYQQELNFDLSDRHIEGLELYASLCKKHGLLK